MYQESLLPTFPVALGFIGLIALMVVVAFIQMKVHKHRQNKQFHAVEDNCLTCE
jgi:uncharacterized membrane protein